MTDLSQDPTAHGHAILGCSSSHRWTTCTASAAVSLSLPNEESPHAARGTHGHAMAEALLEGYIAGVPREKNKAYQALIDKTNNEEAAAYLDESLQETVDVFVEYVIGRHKEMIAEFGAENVHAFPEQRVSLSRWIPEGFGSADFIAVSPKKILVCDLKAGVGVRVDAKHNSQLRCYAAGALDKFGWMYDVERVECVIVQPGIDNISGEELTVHELIHYMDEFIKPRAEIAWEAVLGNWSRAKFSPSDECSRGFCKARFRCPARARWALEQADVPINVDKPLELLPIDDLERLAGNAAAPIKWLSDVKRGLLQEASAGRVELKHWTVDHTKGTRVIKDQAAAAKALMQAGFGAGAIYREPQLRGILQLETLVGGPAKLQEILGDTLGLTDPSPYLRPLREGESQPPGEADVQPLGSADKDLEGIDDSDEAS